MKEIIGCKIDNNYYNYDVHDGDDLGGLINMNDNDGCCLDIAN